MEMLMTLIGFFLVGYIGYLAIDRIPALKNFFENDSNFPIFLQGTFWRNALSNKEIQKRFIFTLAIIALLYYFYI